ncbi:MAG: hypothetical protein QM796_08255 [Chthoniobacteraceae bacterium]
MNAATNQPSRGSSIALSRASALKQKLRHLFWQRHELSMQEVCRAASFSKMCHAPTSNVR